MDVIRNGPFYESFNRYIGKLFMTKIIKINTQFYILYYKIGKNVVK